MNKQVPEMQSILAGQSLQVFFPEKKQNVICVSFGLFKHRRIWGAGSSVALNVRVPVCAHALGLRWEFYTRLSLAVELPNELIQCVQTPWGKLPGRTASEALVKTSERPVPKLEPTSLWWSPSLCEVTLIIFTLTNLGTVSLPSPSPHAGVNRCGWFMDPSGGPSDGEPLGDDLSAITPKHHGFSAAAWGRHIPSAEAHLHPGCTRVCLTKPCSCLGGSSKAN